MNVLGQLRLYLHYQGCLLVDVLFMFNQDLYQLPPPVGIKVRTRSLARVSALVR